MKIGCRVSPLKNAFIKDECLALAGVAQWTECQSVNQRVAGLIPSQGTCLGCGPSSWTGGAGEATTH